MSEKSRIREALTPLYDNPGKLREALEKASTWEDRVAAIGSFLLETATEARSLRSELAGVKDEDLVEVISELAGKAIADRVDIPVVPEFAEPAIAKMFVAKLLGALV